MSGNKRRTAGEFAGEFLRENMTFGHMNSTDMADTANIILMANKKCYNQNNEKLGRTSGTKG